VTDIREAGERLRAAGVPSPEHDARTLIRYAEKTGADPDGLLLARASRIPLQHLLGTAAFRYLELDVGPGVFVPRPETELLVDAVLAALGSRTATPTATATQAPVVVDLCAGSGAIGLSVAHEHPDAVVHLVESSPEAFDWLARNAARATPGRVHLHLADLAVAPSGLDGAVDVVVSNPPCATTTRRSRCGRRTRALPSYAGSSTGRSPCCGRVGRWSWSTRSVTSTPHPRCWGRPGSSTLRSTTTSPDVPATPPAGAHADPSFRLLP
jgi:hypothetical protein